MDKQKPLLTFAILAYNQEQYIREAVEAAFSQTYEPLQIILSDDCSPDRTFEIMQEMAAAYTGPHTVCLNRNVVNKHIGGHVNAIMKLAKGELVVIAAGDDVSAPHRTQETFNAWDAAGRPEYCSIFSAVEQWGVGIASRHTPAKTIRKERYYPYLFDDSYVYNGSGHAWTTSTFRLFGDFAEGLVNEDTVLAVRNTVAGHLLFIDESLVRHRQHSENTGAAGRKGRSSSEALAQFYLTFLKRREAVVRCFHADFLTAQRNQLPNLKKFGGKRFRHAMHALTKEQRLCLVGHNLIQGGLFKRTLLLARCLFGTTATARFLRRSWLQVLSPHLYVTLRRWVRK